MKHKKLIFSVFIILLLIGSILPSVLSYEPIIEERNENILTSLFGGLGFYVTGGTFSDSGTVTRGDLVDTKVSLLFKLTGSKYKVDLYWTNGEDFYPIKVYEKDIPHESGDRVSLSIKNLDTSDIPEGWCGDYIKVAGIHQVYTSSGWKYDYVGEDPFQRRTISENFVLQCDVPCEKEAKEPICSGGNVKQEVVVQSTCSYSFKTLDYCADDEECNNAVCVPKTETCQVKNKVCSGDRVVVEYDNCAPTFDKVCSSTEECVDGECQYKEPEVVPGVDIWIIEDNECLKLSVPQDQVESGAITNEQDCLDLIVDDLGEDNDSTGQDTGSNQEQKWYEELFDFENNRNIAISATVLSVLILLTIIYLVVPNKYWKKLAGK